MPSPENPLLGKIVQQRAGQKQAPVNDPGIEPRQVIGQPQHVGRVHQKAGQEAVVHALGRRDRPEGLEMPLEHRAGDGLIVGILHGVDQAADLLQTLVRIDRSDRHEGRHVILVIAVRHTDAACRELRRALELGDLPADLDDPAGVGRVRADGAGVVPDLQVDRAGAVGQHAG